MTKKNLYVEQYGYADLHTARDIEGNDPGGCSLTFRGNAHPDDVAFVSEKIGEIMKEFDAMRRAREGKSKNRPYHLTYKRLPPT